MNRRQFALASVATLAPGVVRADAGPALKAAIDDPRRASANRERDRFRHPLQSLTFWGLQPGMTVVEIDPAGGYWTEILGPYLKSTGGRYIAAVGGDPAPFEARFANAALWGPMAIVPFGKSSGPLAPPGSADMVLTARNIHDWMWVPGMVDKVFGDFHAALHPGGILAVEQHRADPRPMVPEARDGYVSTAFVVTTARKAGFRLDGSSEINANPKDTKDYPFGVWTLPPTRRTHEPGKPTPPGFDPARYEAIGESDRMTLRFRRT
ncbi:MAG TPA: methyltransferase [Caulobacteraceae bacterium]|nr:methyltransferase [Caulobacteraceae bacterium]